MQSRGKLRSTLFRTPIQYRADLAGLAGYTLGLIIARPNRWKSIYN
jgi:hypothetical protein